jgi:hypothetical protein
MNKHQAELTVKVYSIISWIAAAFTFIAALFLLFLGPFFGSGSGRALIENTARASVSLNWNILSGVIAGVSVVFGVLFLLVAALQVWIGLSLRDRKEWARIAWIVWGVLMLLSFPLGTLIGGFAIYAFGFRKEVKALFKH